MYLTFYSRKKIQIWAIFMFNILDKDKNIDPRRSKKLSFWVH